MFGRSYTPIGMSDVIFLGFLVICLVLLVGITVTMVYFIIRYSRKRHPQAEQIPGNIPLEIIWTVLPTVLVLGMFYYGWVGFKTLRQVPGDALQISVTGRMWTWTFEYPNGLKANTLKVPVKKAVNLNLISADVLHSFFVPAFRIKEDAVPGMKTYLWFQAEREGTYDVFCSEYCGTGHSGMLSKIEVVSQDVFDQWYAGETAKPVKAPDGAALVVSAGCTGCHSLDGSRIVGPSLKGIFGEKTHVLTDGVERDIVVDEDYIRRSLLEPGKDVVEGYPAIMPAQTQLSAEEIDAIIDYLKTLK